MRVLMWMVFASADASSFMATLTTSPNTSYWGCVTPTTPEYTCPTCMPMRTCTRLFNLSGLRMWRAVRITSRPKSVARTSLWVSESCSLDNSVAVLKPAAAKYPSPMVRSLMICRWRAYLSIALKKSSRKIMTSMALTRVHISVKLMMSITMITTCLWLWDVICRLDLSKRKRWLYMWRCRDKASGSSPTTCLTRSQKVRWLRRSSSCSCHATVALHTSAFTTIRGKMEHSSSWLARTALCELERARCTVKSKMTDTPMIDMARKRYRSQR
mmetsp:Transcript_16050/g.30828  ORF Transcript_16050/g.30828 Transcript_16050/m.30828 type:complete len:271 (-) Transcript_16050:495-1307(-)